MRTAPETGQLAQEDRFDFGIIAFTHEQAAVIAICLLLLIIRICLINLNTGEYTDGILQITRYTHPEFSGGAHFWPPLYGLLTYGMSLLNFDIETAGKLISIFASVAVLIPIYLIARMIDGKLCALYAILIYAAQPIPWRWSIRVMSDSLFVFFFVTSLWVTLYALRETEKATRFKLKAFVDRRVPEPSKILTYAIIAGLLAGFTRYQGFLLLPLELYAIWKLYSRPIRRRESAIALPLVALAGWTLIIHMYLQSPHQDQFAERAGHRLAIWLIANLHTIEDFIYLFPYYVTLPVFIFIVWGWVAMLRSGKYSDQQFCWISAYLIIALLLMQTLFKSFQERYLLPVIPIVAILAAFAFTRWSRRGTAPGRLLRSITAALILMHALTWSAAVLMLQREAWGDVRKAAEHLKAHELPITSSTPIFCHEIYNAQHGIGAVKMSYWSGYNITSLPLNGLSLEHLPEKSYIVIISAYTGWNQVVELKEALEAIYELRPIQEYQSQLIPLFPDIMQTSAGQVNPNQNALAWFYRYTEQNFVTRIYYIEKRRSAGRARQP
ncbi:glycosyltransferase family 39 protein [Candidatus Sumerlaeota bacterium]|nr:glycosyltransferase family 39 protein [Candidatus Sumerlaeota bacterium]